MSEPSPTHAITSAIVDLASQLAERLAAPDPTTRITSISVMMALDRLTDRALRAVVQEARTEGFSWQQIGDITGTTRQGAAQRFGGANAFSFDELVLAPIPDAPALATMLVQAFLNDEREVIRAYMTTSMRASLPDRRFSAALTSIETAFGTLVSVSSDGAEVALLGDATVVSLPVRLTGGMVKATLTFSPDSRLLGLWLNPDSSQGEPFRG